MATAPATARLSRVWAKRMHGGRTTRTLGIHLARVVPLPRAPDLCCLCQTQKETRARGEGKDRLASEIAPVGWPELGRHPR